MAIGQTAFLIILKGDIPSPANPPSGCVFRTRCSYAADTCAAAPPVLTEESRPEDLDVFLEGLERHGLSDSVIARCS
jgi:oligopeptide/dipeptide ABC transporter ATP-binding protein